jgi:uncharacterized protein YqeY
MPQDDHDDPEDRDDPEDHTPADAGALRAQLRVALTDAMKARDTVAVRVLRTTIGAIENAEAVPAGAFPGSDASQGHIAGAATGVGATEAARREMTVDDVLEIVGQEMRERVVEADQYEAGGHEERAHSLRAEAAVLAAFLTDERRRRFLRAPELELADAGDDAWDEATEDP